MKDIEPAQLAPDTGLTARIRAFWTQNINAERIMGRTLSNHQRGSEQYFNDLMEQRYRSHRHLLPWINTMDAGSTVLEIGSGIGLDSYTLARRGLQVVALDLTEVAIGLARDRFRESGLMGSFLVADSCALPFPSETFDYVYSFGVLHHVADTQSAIDEVHRVLRPGGEARIMLYHRHSLNEVVHRLTRIPFEERHELCPVVRRFNRSEVHELFRAYGQIQLSLEYAFGEGYGILFKLTPRWLYNLLSKYFGWHIMISAHK